MRYRLHWSSFLLALGLLSRLPLVYSAVNRALAAEAEADGSQEPYQQSPLWYPVVGLLLAAIIGTAFTLLHYLQLPNLLLAALTLAIWVWLSGALHLDGLADCVDALYVAHAEPAAMRRVMTEPHCGAMAIVHLTLLLLLKFAALCALSVSLSHIWSALLVALVASRFSAALMMATTACVSHSVFTLQLHPQRHRKSLIAIGMVVFGLLLLVCPLPIAALVALSLAGLLLWWRRLWTHCIGGYTGDVIGALIEISELAVLLLMVLSL